MKYPNTFTFQWLLNAIGKAAIILVFIFINSFTGAQTVLQHESFESSIFDPPGWREQKINSLGGFFSRISAASSNNPSAPNSPGGATRIWRYNSDNAGADDTLIMITKPFDFSNRPGGPHTCQLRFYMYRNNNSSANLDRVRIFYNTIPSLAGASLLTNTRGTTVINRPRSASPNESSTGWYEYFYNLPNSAFYKNLRGYFLFQCISENGNNMYFDQVEVDTYPTALNASDVSTTLTIQNASSVVSPSTDQWIIGLKFCVNGSSGSGNRALGTALKLDSILLNTNGTTNVTDISNAKIYYTGGSPIYATDYISPFVQGGYVYTANKFGQTINSPGTNLDFSADSCTFYLEYDTTYFWLTYSINSGLPVGENFDGDFRGAAVGGTGCPVSGQTSVIPLVSALTGFVFIDINYGSPPQMNSGTSWNNYGQGPSFLGGNDYINQVELHGEPLPSPYILSTYNTNGPFLPNPPYEAFAAHPPDYEFFSTLFDTLSNPQRRWTAVLKQGATYPSGTGTGLRLQAGTWQGSGNQNRLAAWIDWNHNGVFGDIITGCSNCPVSEKIGEASASALGNANFAVTVPDADWLPGYTGATRMRVREVYDQSNLSPTASYQYGETEDYTVTIIPDCPFTYKLWLGYTNDWANNANWCGGVPTINDDAHIDKVSVNPSGNYYNPVIKSSTAAKAKTLTIVDALDNDEDSLIINGAKNTSLKLKGDLINNGVVRVVSNYSDSIQLSNGGVLSNTYTPFKGGSSNARMQLIYLKSDFEGPGGSLNPYMIAGDSIYAFLFHIRDYNSINAAYPNFTVSWGTTLLNEFPNNTPLASPSTIAYGPANLSLGAGSIGSSKDFTLTLTNPIPWDGLSNIVIQFCFDGNTQVSANGNDDRLWVTQTTGRKSVINLSSSNGPDAGCSMTAGGTVSDNNWSLNSSYRPNITFLYKRPYSKPLITMQRDIINNGVIIPGISKVVLDSAQNQIIGGAFSTSFYTLEMKKSAASQTITLNKNITVDDTLFIDTGKLLLNQNQVIISNNNTWAITKPSSGTTGIIISEDSLSKIKWKMDTINGSHVFPFGNNTGSHYIPVNIRPVNNADLGTVSVATYGTGTANTPWPPTVLHIQRDTITAYNDSAFMANRYWILEKTGTAPSPNTQIVFNFTEAEKPAGVVNAIAIPKLQPWYLPSKAWLNLNTVAYPLSYFTSGFGAATVHRDSLRNWNWSTGNYAPWAITQNTHPLPIELISFDAKLIDDKVQLLWTTNSETNNDYYTVQRTTDFRDFQEIAKVNSYHHNSNSISDYDVWDNYPNKGINYYRLLQTDLGGIAVPASDFVAVRIETKSLFNILHVVKESGLQVYFDYDSNDPVDFVVTDAMGKIVSGGNTQPAQSGINILHIQTRISNGLYFITLRNKEQAVTRKFIY